ncbi:glycosyltransferase family 2 protein [Curvularia clavata]|uniref:Glycosyltransferase family 2 protein n=1 Tax=Curvularia clavata TaxID=95742 RepID=A0A9Q8Z9P2_CURCL|nr:glycosyltransferase family 2 protein [Curvularia clavata]
MVSPSDYPSGPYPTADYVTGARRSSEIVPASQDVAVPAHLLRATGNLGSKRDKQHTAHTGGWNPLPENPFLDSEQIGGIRRNGTLSSSIRRNGTQRSAVRQNSNRVHRNDTQRSTNIDRTPSESDHRRSVRFSINQPSNTTSHRNVTVAPANDNGPFYHRLSYVAGSTDVLDVTPRQSRAPTPTLDGRSSVGSNYSNENPFESKADSIKSDPFATENNTPRASFDATPQQPEIAHQSSLRRKNTLQSVVGGLQRSVTNASYFKRSELFGTYEKAKKKGVEIQRKKWVQITFEYSLYLIMILFIYFVLIGMPLWKGAVWWMYWVVQTKFVLPGGFGITLGIALFLSYAFAPLCILFEKDPPPADFTTETKTASNVADTCLMIPCYKSAGLIANTLEAALKIFPPSHIFVIANGNSPTPLDNTEEICRPYGVNHIWSPIGSKIVAQFVGCYAAKNFKNVLLIDDDCALPENFPVVTDRMTDKVKCIGYTIKSVGPNGSKGNLCQQAQDLEYKLSGIQREFAGKIGSATFPHGAISLWDRELLIKTFHEHPGFSVSEDWFFGHVARQLGSRIKMCSQVFVETETPTAVFFAGGGSRGGFGEMTIFSQRFKRWNFFFVNGMYYNMAYILCDWKLGWWEIGAKIFVFQEVYETLLYLLTPFILPISFIVRPDFCGYLLAATVVMYLINVIIFNEVHLRRKNERVGWVLLYGYYLPYKIVLTFVNVASCYWSLYKYARYFAKRHPKVIEDEKAVEVVIRLEEDQHSNECGLGRRLTVRTVGGRPSVDEDDVDTSAAAHEVLTPPEPICSPGLRQDSRPSSSALRQEGVAAKDYFNRAQTNTAVPPEWV